MKTHKKDQNSEIKPLTSIRFFGALWVILLHLRPSISRFYILPQVVDSFFSIGYLGVDFFLILSGYILCDNYYYSFNKSINAKKYITFLIRRIARVWPTHAVTTFLSLPILLVTHYVFRNFGAPNEEWWNINYFLQTLLLVNQFGMKTVTYMFNQPSWTISGEMALYLLFPVIILLTSSINSSRFKISKLNSILMILLMFSIPIIGEAFFIKTPYGWLLRLTLNFVTGIFLALNKDIVTRIPKKLISCFHFLPLLIPILLIFTSKSLIIPLLGFWILSLTTGDSYVIRILSNNFLHLLGKLSYGLYLYHWIVFQLYSLSVISFGAIFSTNSSRFILLCFMIVFLFILSWFNWKYFEENFRKKLRNLDLYV